MRVSRLLGATTHTQTGSIRINATPEKLWDLITHVDAIHEWYDSWDAVSHDTADGRMRVGASFRLSRRHRGCKQIAHCRVTELTPPTRLQWVQSMPNQPLVTVTFHAIPDSCARATELVNTRTWTAP